MKPVRDRPKPASTSAARPAAASGPPTLPTPTSGWHKNEQKNNILYLKFKTFLSVLTTDCGPVEECPDCTIASVENQECEVGGGDGGGGGGIYSKKLKKM